MQKSTYGRLVPTNKARRDRDPGKPEGASCRCPVFSAFSLSRSSILPRACCLQLVCVTRSGPQVFGTMPQPVVIHLTCGGPGTPARRESPGRNARKGSRRACVHNTQLPDIRRLERTASCLKVVRAYLPEDGSEECESPSSAAAHGAPGDEDGNRMALEFRAATFRFVPTDKTSRTPRVQILVHWYLCERMNCSHVLECVLLDVSRVVPALELVVGTALASAVRSLLGPSRHAQAQYSSNVVAVCVGDGCQASVDGCVGLSFLGALESRDRHACCEGRTEGAASQTGLQCGMRSRKAKGAWRPVGNGRGADGARRGECCGGRIPFLIASVRA